MSDLDAMFAAPDFYAKPRSEIFELETQLKTARDKVRTSTRAGRNSSSCRASRLLRFRFLYHKPLMMDALKGIDDRSRKESAGLSWRDRSTRRNHQPSRTDQIAQDRLVGIREMKRAAIKAGKPWPPRNRKLLTLS